MKNIILSVLLALPTLAFASPQTTIDLQKFASKANFAISAAFGKGLVVAGSGRMVWVDGIGNDNEVAPDLSSLNYIMEMKSEITPLPNYFVAYRLSLGGGRLELRLISDADGYAAYALPGSVNVTFRDSASLDDLKNIEVALLEINPKASVQLYEYVNVMNVTSKPSEFSELYRFLTVHPSVVSVAPNREGYSMEAHILPMRNVPKSGKLDLETLRDVSKDRELYPKAFVPLKLR